MREGCVSAGRSDNERKAEVERPTAAASAITTGRSGTTWRRQMSAARHGWRMVRGKRGLAKKRRGAREGVGLSDTVRGLLGSRNQLSEAATSELERITG